MKILLAIDYSTFAQGAVRAVIRQVQPRGTLVRVLHVVAPAPALISTRMSPDVVPYFEKAEEDRRKQAKKLVLDAAQKLRKAGFTAKEIVDTGDPKERIIRYATEWGADLIVLGSHGWKGLGRFLMGSVSEAVTRHAECSVQVVRIRRAAKRTKARKSKL